MDPTILAIGPQLRTAGPHVLILDYDGTLAPFKTDRAAAFPYAGVTELLRQISMQASTRLVVLSGRAIADLLPLLGDLSLREVWGSHGWERVRDGSHESKSLPEPARAALARARAFLATEGLDAGREDKPFGLALHWRGRPADEASRLRAVVLPAWRRIALGTGLDIREFDGGLELRPDGFDKGSAVTEILADSGAADAGVAYLGDDLTDEDAFAAVNGRGLSVLVREVHRPTLASAWIRPPDELLEFLAFWRDHAAAGGTS